MSYAREAIIMAVGSVSLPPSGRRKKREQTCAKWNLSLMNLWKVSSFLKGGIKDTQLISSFESPSRPYDNASRFQYLLQLLVRK